MPLAGWATVLRDPSVAASIERRDYQRITAAQTNAPLGKPSGAVRPLQQFALGRSQEAVSFFARRCVSSSCENAQPFRKLLQKQRGTRFTPSATHSPYSSSDSSGFTITSKSFWLPISYKVVVDADTAPVHMIGACLGIVKRSIIAI
jgi:hypothetical protein